MLIITARRERIQTLKLKLEAKRRVKRKTRLHGTTAKLRHAVRPRILFGFRLKVKGCFSFRKCSYASNSSVRLENVKKAVYPIRLLIAGYSFVVISVLFLSLQQCGMPVFANAVLYIGDLIFNVFYFYSFSRTRTNISGIHARSP